MVLSLCYTLKLLVKFIDLSLVFRVGFRYSCVIIREVSASELLWLLLTRPGCRGISDVLLTFGQGLDQFARLPLRLYLAVVSGGCIRRLY